MSENSRGDKGAKNFKPPIIPARLDGSLDQKTVEYVRSNEAKDAAFEERVRLLKEYIVKNRVNADELDHATIKEIFDQAGQIANTKWDKKRFYDGWQELPNSSLIYAEGRTMTHSRRLKETVTDDEEISNIHTGAAQIELCYKDKEGKLVRMILDTSKIPGHENWGQLASVGRLRTEISQFLAENDSGDLDWRNAYVVQAVLDEVEKKKPGNSTEPL